MPSQKLSAGSTFPPLVVKSLDGKEADISKPADGVDWRLIVVYRGKHCPMCTIYLNNLEKKVKDLQSTGVDVVAVSADTAEQLQGHLEKLDVSFPIYHGLSPEQMDDLGLYISHPRSEAETDHLFPEPGIFVINRDGNLHVVDISNNPFVRPDLDTLTNGLKWIKNPDNNYPIRGTHPDGLIFEERK